MVETSELLRRVPAFEGLPDDQIAWFLSNSQELHLNAGDTYARQGEPADAMFVLLDPPVGPDQRRTVGPFQSATATPGVGQAVAAYPAAYDPGQGGPAAGPATTSRSPG